MEALATLPIPEAYQGARLFVQKGRSMAPTIEHNQPVAVVPTDRYDGPALYVLDMLGAPAIYRVEAIGPNRLRLKQNDPCLPDHDVDGGLFHSVVLARVIGKFVYC